MMHDRSDAGPFAARLEDADDPDPSRSCASVDVLDPSDRLSPEALAWLHARIADVLAYLRAAGEVRARLVGDFEMAEAHQRFCGVPGTTDVITFDLADGASAHGLPLDADLLLCFDEAHRQAAARGVPVERELLLYALHGVLHCLGEDDHDEEAFERMHAREDEILTAIGVGPTFGAGARGGGPDDDSFVDGTEGSER